jgi:hypothetical protein
MYCLQCRLPRGGDVICRGCGYAYLSPPDFSQPTETSDDSYSDGMPVYVPTGCFSAVLLLVITGTNPTGVAVIVVATMIAMLVASVSDLGRGWVLLIFGAAALGFDLLSRRMLRCSIGDTKRGSQFMKVPVWVIGFMLVILGGSIIVAK